MKKLILSLCILMMTMTVSVQKTQAQIPVLQIIQGGVKKVIKAVDLKIQRLQNKTIWLQNAEKTLENEMSKLKLKEISDWAVKQKELYASYFDELWKVKNALQTYQNVKDIVDKQLQLVTEYSRAFNLSKQDKNFSAEELAYMQEVYSGILKESLKNIEQVDLVVTSFATQMSDAKRLEIIHKASDNMETNLSDLRQFNQQNLRISLQRAKERNDVDAVKKMYGIE